MPFNNAIGKRDLLCRLSIQVALLAGLGPVVVAPASADDTLIEQLVDANTYELRAEAGAIGGPGLKFLLDATRDAQFFCFAEPHNIKQVPGIFTQLFEALQTEHGYHYAALETGPFVLEEASKPPVLGDRAEVNRLFARYPTSFHFCTDEELQMIADLGRLSTAKAAPLWGVDQVHGTLLVLDTLRESCDDPKIQAKLYALCSDVRKVNKRRRTDKFIRNEGDAFDHLHDWLQPRPDSRIAFLTRQLQLSHKIYRDYFRAEQGEPTGYESNFEREENMKALFMHYYKAAQAAGDAMPKVMLKSGHWHMMKGISPGHCYTLGQFEMDFAKSNGLSSFHLTVSVVNEGKNASSITNYPQYDPVTRAGGGQRWTVVDLRPLRAYVHSGALRDLHADLRHWIFSYDAVLMIGGGSTGGYVTEANRMLGRL